MIWLKNLLLELGPLLLFFVVDEYYGFFPAVAALIVSTLLTLLYTWYGERRLPYFALFTAVTVGLFGGVSILLKDADWFIISDTFLDIGFALALYISLWFKKPLLQVLFESSFAITDQAWRILTVRWTILFLLLAVVSEAIRQLYSVDTWVQFKALSVFIILGFGCYQFTLSRKMRLPEVSNSWGLRIK